MRWLFLSLLLLFAMRGLPADDVAPTPDNIVQEFSGSGTTTTGLFKVQDRWEVRWNARQVVSVAVISSDGTIVAGAAGVLRGSLFVPLGGQYYFKISDGTVPPPVPTTAPAASTNAAPVADANAPPVTPTPSADTNAAPVATTNTPPVSDTNSAPLSATTNAPPITDTNARPMPPPAPVDVSGTPPAEPVAASWHLQIVQVGASADSDQSLTVYTPFFMPPDSAITPSPAPVDLPPPVLTSEQAQSVVTIKGDNAQGAGFLMRTPEGTFVVTHLRLLAANPNTKISTTTGAPITKLGLKGATDRDLALFAIKDDHYSYLPFSPNAANQFDSGDPIIIPDIAAQSEVLLGKPGRILGLSPERIDFDTHMDPGSSGSPVIHVKSGNVLALVTDEKQVDISDNIAKNWTANPAPGASGIIPFYGLRLGGAQGWETYDPARFLAETTFLKQFHHETRCLDSYLNGKHHRSLKGEEEKGPPDSYYYLTSPKLRAATDTYRHFANGADRAQRLDAARELLSDLQTVADTGIDTLQGAHQFYAYDQTRAQEEMTYRKALKKELDDLGSNIIHLDNIARTH